MKDIKKARRYLGNAKAILLEKATNEDGSYDDRKYVKMAGKKAYAAVLASLDAVLGTHKKDSISIDCYEKERSAIDQNMLAYFDAAYDTLALAMGYDGNLSVGVSNAGIGVAEKIVGWAEQKTKAL
ncbi:hypothetical protein SAMN05216327_10641 [Dyadobacter sp. SG02]|uniref:DUF5618 family protein n=1 Tax=Dyadobacter sp. SG02 TaxID=1855291 RepID=UPI0008BCA47E|nr:DUF5618 family protein [Dyadobacter sp. SG02]SEJ09595.1 hypothetical protein SAMN05216327_10641 [Dyadobacter sp. SG02]